MVDLIVNLLTSQLSLNLQYGTVTDCMGWMALFILFDLIKGQTINGHQDLRSWMMVLNPFFSFIRYIKTGMLTKGGNYLMILFFTIGWEPHAWLEILKEQCAHFSESSLFGYGNCLLHDTINHLPAFTILFWSTTVLKKKINCYTTNCLVHGFNI